jgi:hypothetical protein
VGHSSSVISEAMAWKILHEYVQDCLRIDSDTLIAVYAIGSLGGGYYRPGQSDIDAVLIVADGSEGIWGDSEMPSERLKALSERYQATYDIPKEFGSFPLQPHELYPPYAEGVTLEVARLKLQGKCVYGSFALDDVPLPTPDDFVRDFGAFERWWRDEFTKGKPIESLSSAACVNTTLMHLRRFLIAKRGIIEFNKRRIVPLYLENDPSFVDELLFELVTRYLEMGSASQDKLELLREHTRVLRDRMNALLGITPPSH